MYEYDLRLFPAQTQLFLSLTTIQEWVQWDAESDERLRPLEKVEQESMKLTWTQGCSEKHFSCPTLLVEVASLASATSEKTSKTSGWKFNQQERAIQDCPMNVKRGKKLRNLKRCFYWVMSHFGRGCVCGFLPFKSCFMTTYLREDLG